MVANIRVREFVCESRKGQFAQMSGREITRYNFSAKINLKKGFSRKIFFFIVDENNDHPLGYEQVQLKATFSQ